MLNIWRTFVDSVFCPFGEFNTKMVFEKRHFELGGDAQLRSEKNDIARPAQNASIEPEYAVVV